MTAISVGRVCTVKKGRRIGTEVTVTSMISQSFVMTKNAKGKERKYAIVHLEALASGDRELQGSSRDLPNRQTDVA